MVVELRDVSQRFVNRWVLSHVHLRLQKGAAILLTGENGAGKTTLLRIMATALRPTRGVVRLFGEVVVPQQSETLRARLALITHQNYLYDNLSAIENLQLVARLTQRCDAGECLSRLAEVGLLAHAESPVRFFSAGMKRRLAFARLLLLRPELVFLDEPFGQLDPEGVRMVTALVKNMRAAETTLVMSTHDIERGHALCDEQLHLTLGGPSAPLQTIEH